MSVKREIQVDRKSVTFKQDTAITTKEFIDKVSTLNGEFLQIEDIFYDVKIFSYDKRLETDEEVQARLDKISETKKYQEEIELRQYKLLKEKYGDIDN